MSFLHRKDFLYPLLIWIIFLFWYLIFFDYFKTFQIKFQNFFTSQAFYLFSSKSLPETKDKIVIVALDEKSRLYLKQKWPWRRSLFAELLKNIISARPKTIGIDIVFSEKSSPSEDKILTSVIKSYPHIVLAYVLRKKPIFPEEEFIKSAKAVGFVNRISEEEAVRKTRVFHIDKDNHKVYYSIDVGILADYWDISRSQFKLIPQKGLYLKDKFIPAPGGVTPINYLVHPTQFFLIPAYLILEKKINLDVLKNKIVLIGATDPLVHDEYLTPLGNMWGVAIMGNSLVMMLSNRFIHELPQGLFIISILIFGVLIILFSQLSLWRSILFNAFLFIFLYFSSLFLRSKDIQFDYFSFFFLLFSSSVISNVYRYSYLSYISNKIKNLAIKDPLTDFFTLRYFLIKWDEELKQKDLGIIAIKIINYKELSLSLTYESLKEIVKRVAQFIKNNLRMHFPKAIFSCFSRDVFIIAVEEKKKNLEEILEDLIRRLEEKVLYLEDKNNKVSLKSILIFKKKNITLTAKDILSQIAKFNEEVFNQKEKVKICFAEKSDWIERRTFEESLDFLLKDLEEKNKDLEKALKEALEAKKETEEAYFEVIYSLIKALEEKDPYTRGHSERVAKYAYAIAKESGLSEEECRKIYKAGLLHDVGKIGIPEYILHKKEKLTHEEWEIIRKHEIMSIEILKPIKALSSLFSIILHHHERFDGTGYPYGLSGNMIPQGAQILAVADAFDAITCGRGYKRGKALDEAIKELEKNKGTQFNPKYVDILKKIVSSDEFKFPEV